MMTISRPLGLLAAPDKFRGTIDEMVEDFVIYAHSDLEMTKKLLDREPLLINGFMDWGAGDWESGLGGASHMGRHDIVGFLLERGARRRSPRFARSRALPT